MFLLFHRPLPLDPRYQRPFLRAAQRGDECVLSVRHHCQQPVVVLNPLDLGTPLFQRERVVGNNGAAFAVKRTDLFTFFNCDLFDCGKLKIV